MEKEMSEEMYYKAFFCSWYCLEMSLSELVRKENKALNSRTLFRIFECALSENKQNHSHVLFPAPLGGY